MQQVSFNNLDDVDHVLTQVKDYLYKVIMTKASAVGGLDVLEQQTGIEKLERDVKRGKITDMLRIAKQL